MAVGAHVMVLIPMHLGFIDVVSGGIVQGSIQDEPLADRLVTPYASNVHGSCPAVVRLGNVIDRAHFEQPLANRR